jgi:uncharacterized membrane protein
MRTRRRFEPRLKERLAQRLRRTYIRPVSTAPCICGSGRPLELCHELPRRERRRHARQLQALGEAHDISVLFPWVRPHDPVVDAFAERVALELDPDDSFVPPQVIEDGVALLDRRERDRIVETWAERYSEAWASLCAAAGDDELLRHAVVASAVRGAICERRPPPRECVEPLEMGLLRGAPCSTLAFVIAPALVWTREQAVVVAGAVAHLRSTRERFDALHDLTNGWVAEQHVDRVRVLAARLQTRLPVDGLPQASETLAEGCRQVEAEEELAAGLAAVLLATYALSLG